MNRIAPILLLLILAGQAEANSYFKVVDVSPIHLAPGTATNFTVTLRSLGGSGAFAEPMFNATVGLSATETGGLKYIVATGSRTYNCTMKAENIAPGNYSFQVGVYAQNAPYSWRTAYAVIEAPKKATVDSVNATKNRSSLSQPNMTESRESKSIPAKTPGPGLLFAIACLILVSRRPRI